MPYSLLVAICVRMEAGRLRVLVVRTAQHISELEIAAFLSMFKR